MRYSPSPSALLMEKGLGDEALTPYSYSVARSARSPCASTASEANAIETATGAKGAPKVNANVEASAASCGSDVASTNAIVRTR